MRKYLNHFVLFLLLAALFFDAYLAYGAGCGLVKLTTESGEVSAEEIYKNNIMKNHHGGVVLVARPQTSEQANDIEDAWKDEGGAEVFRSAD